MTYDGSLDFETLHGIFADGLLRGLRINGTYAFSDYAPRQPKQRAPRMRKRCLAPVSYNRAPIGRCRNAATSDYCVEHTPGGLK